MVAKHEFLNLYYALNESERKQFTAYVRKDYQLSMLSKKENQEPNNKQITKERNLTILQFLKKTKGDAEAFNKDKLLKKLNFNSTDPKLLGNQMSGLFKQCLEWIVLEACREKKNDDVNLLLLKTFKKRNLAEEGFKKWSNRVARELEASPYRDINYHYHSWLRTHLSTFRVSKRQLEDRNIEAELNQAEAELDAFYALAKLRYHYERIAIARLKNSPNNTFSLAEIDSFSQKQLTASFPLIRYYAYIIQAELSNDDSFYDTALEILSNYDHQVSPAEIPAYYVCLYNYASKKFNEENGIERLFDLQQLALERDWVTGGGQLTVNLFNTLVNTSCLLGKVELVNSIIENYGHRLPLEQKDSCVAVAKARVFFQQKEYENALTILKTTPFHFELAMITIQSLQIRCCYELGGDYLIEAKTHCTNLRRNIYKKEKLPEEIKTRALNFTEITSMFFYKKPDWNEISSKIEKTPKIICRDWLREKVNEQMVSS